MRRGSGRAGTVAEAKESRARMDLLDAAANDDGGVEARIEAAVTTLARLLGRRIARDEYERLNAANDNRPVHRTGKP